MVVFVCRGVSAPGRRFNHQHHLYTRSPPLAGSLALGSGRTRARISREQSEFPGKYTYFLIVYLFKFRHPRTRQREEFYLFAGRLQHCLLGSFGRGGIDRQRSNASTVALQICTFSGFLLFLWSTQEWEASGRSLALSDSRCKRRCRLGCWTIQNGLSWCPLLG